MLKHNMLLGRLPAVPQLLSTVIHVAMDFPSIPSIMGTGDPHDGYTNHQPL